MISNETSKMFEDYLDRAPAVNKDRAVLRKDAKKAKPAASPRSGSGESIDLHGLTLEQAVVRVERRLASLSPNRRGPVTFVTGEGNRSITSYSVLKSGIGDFLSDNRGRFGIVIQSVRGGWEVWFEK